MFDGILKLVRRFDTKKSYNGTEFMSEKALGVFNALCTYPVLCHSDKLERPRSANAEQGRRSNSVNSYSVVFFAMPFGLTKVVGFRR